MYNTLYQKAVFSVLRKYTLGELVVSLPDGSTKRFGDSSQSPLSAEITVKDLDFFKKVALQANVGLGEAYMDELWETPDLRAVIEWFATNIGRDRAAKGSSSRIKGVGLLRFLDRNSHKLRANSKSGSRKNIEEHYDLGNDFYRLWLDPSMTYSSGKFTQDTTDLEQAQANKYEALCDKLKLSEDDHVLEIGCGWGGFSIYAAKTYGCKVTGITISPSQLEEAQKRVKEANLDHLIDLRIQDYRDLKGQYTKIASIEMLEAVGDEFLEGWCEKVHELLAPNGLLAVQMITVPDCNHENLRRGTDFIQRHIFPGSLLLSVGRMNEAMNRTGNLFLHGLEDLGT